MSFEDLNLNLDDIINSNYSFSSNEECYFEDDDELLSVNNIENNNNSNNNESENNTSDEAQHVNESKQVNKELAEDEEKEIEKAKMEIGDLEVMEVKGGGQTRGQERTLPVIEEQSDNANSCSLIIEKTSEPVEKKRCVKCNPWRTFGRSSLDDTDTCNDVLLFVEKAENLLEWTDSTETLITDTNDMEQLKDLQHEVNKKVVQIDSLRRLAGKIGQIIRGDGEFKSEIQMLSSVVKEVSNRWKLVNNLLKQILTGSEDRWQDNQKISESTDQDNTQSRIKSEQVDLNAQYQQNKSLENNSNQKNTLNLEFKKLREFVAMYKHRRPALYRPIPVQYCNRHWQDHIWAQRPASVMSNHLANPTRGRSLGNRAASSLGVPLRPRSVAYSPVGSYYPRSRTPTGQSRYSTTAANPSRYRRPASRSFSRRSISPASSVGNNGKEHSDDEIDDLLREVKNLKIPPPPPPPVDLSLFTNPLPGYNVPSLFQCQKCGNSQPLYFPERGLPYIPFLTGFPVPNKQMPKPGQPKINEKPSQKSEPQVGFTNGPNNQFQPNDLPMPYSASSLPRMLPKSGPENMANSMPSMLNLTNDSIPPGSQIFVVPPSNSTFMPTGWLMPGLNGMPLSGTKQRPDQIPPDLQQIMEKYPPRNPNQSEKPPKEKLVQDAMDRFEEKKKQKAKDDYLKALKDKRDQPAQPNYGDFKIKDLVVDENRAPKKPANDPVPAKPNKKPPFKDPISTNLISKSTNKTPEPQKQKGKDAKNSAPPAKPKGSKYRTTCDDEEEILAEMRDEGMLESGNPDSLFDMPDSDDWGTPNPSKLRELELAATVAAKWWEKTQKRIEDKNKGSKPKPGGPKSNLDSLLTNGKPKYLGKMPSGLSDDECVAEFPNRNKLQSAMNDNPFFEDPIASKRKPFKDPISTKLGPAKPRDEKSRSPARRPYETTPSYKKPDEEKPKPSYLTSKSPDSRYTTTTPSSRSPYSQNPASKPYQSKYPNYSTNPSKKDTKPWNPTSTDVSKPLQLEIPGDKLRPRSKSPISRTPEPQSKVEIKKPQVSRVMPTTPRDLTPQFGNKLDKDSDLESVKSDRAPKKYSLPSPAPKTTFPYQNRTPKLSEPAKPRSFQPSVNPSKPSFTSTLSPARKPIQPKIKEPDDDEDDIFLSKTFKPSLQSALPFSSDSLPPSSASGDLLSPATNDDNQLVPFGYGGNRPDDLFDKQNVVGSQAGPGGMVNFGNVNMYILQGDEEARQNAFDQADRSRGGGGGYLNSPRSASSNDGSRFKVKNFHQ